MSQGQYPPPPGGGGYGAPPGGGYGAPPGGGYGAPPGGGYGGPPGGPGAYSPPGWSAGGFAPMPQNLPPGYIPDGGTIPLEGGVPWERDDASFLSRFWDTVKTCNFETRPFFAAAAQNEKMDAITFALLAGFCAGAAVGLFYLVLMIAASAGLMMAMPSLAGGGSRGAGGVGTMAGLTIGVGLFYAVLYVIFFAVVGVIRPFIVGGIHHVLLMLFGGVGERKTFMHTVRVVAYAEGAAGLWIWIPIAGPFITMIFGIKNIAVGYDETHRCGLGRAILVLFAPLLCCCGCFGLMMALGALPAIMKP